jgi:hypothetical protein
VFWEQNRRERERRSHDSASKYQLQLDGFKRRQTSTESDRNSRPGLGGRSGSQVVETQMHKRDVLREMAATRDRDPETDLL